MTGARTPSHLGEIVDRASTGAGYPEASRLAQTGDEDAALALLPPSPRAVLDLGCGTGSLLRRLLDRFPTLRHVCGVDASADRLRQARQLLGPSAGPARVVLVEGDLLDPPDLPGGFDAATMTHVLHWLHPAEARVFGWVHGRLAPEGVLVFTSPHPQVAADGLGGTDELVREALHRLGVRPGEVRPVFDAAGVVPLGTRCRSRAELERLLRPHFTVDVVRERFATLRVSSGTEYARFHAATFGTTYSHLLGADRAEEFFGALVEVAERRMGGSGVVGGHPIRVWRCTRRPRPASGPSRGAARP